MCNVHFEPLFNTNISRLSPKTLPKNTFQNGWLILMRFLMCSWLWIVQSMLVCIYFWSFWRNDKIRGKVDQRKCKIWKRLLQLIEIKRNLLKYRINANVTQNVSCIIILNHWAVSTGTTRIGDWIQSSHESLSNFSMNNESL